MGGVGGGQRGALRIYAEIIRYSGSRYPLYRSSLISPIPYIPYRFYPLSLKSRLSLISLIPYIPAARAVAGYRLRPLKRMGRGLVGPRSFSVHISSQMARCINGSLAPNENMFRTGSQLGTGSSARSNLWRQAAEICNYSGIGWRLSPVGRESGTMGDGSLAPLGMGAWHRMRIWLGPVPAIPYIAYPFHPLSLRSRLSLVSLIPYIPAAGRGVPEDNGDDGAEGILGIRDLRECGLRVEAD